MADLQEARLPLCRGASGLKKPLASYIPAHKAQNPRKRSQKRIPKSSKEPKNESEISHNEPSWACLRLFSDSYWNFWAQGPDGCGDSCLTLAGTSGPNGPAARGALPQPRLWRLLSDSCRDFGPEWPCSSWGPPSTSGQGMGGMFLCCYVVDIQPAQLRACVSAIFSG